MRISLAFTGMAPIASTLPAVHEADRAGLDGVWVAEHVGFHDAIVPATLYLGATQRLEVGIVGLSTATRHPGATAMEVASLAECFPGRVRVAVGTGDPGLVGKLGATLERPARACESFVRALRAALSGAELNVAYDDYAFRGFKLAAPPTPAPAVDLMAIRPRMLATAARAADGVSLSVGASRTYLAETVRDVERALAAAGRDRASFRITALALGVIAKDLDAARRSVLPLMAMAEPSMAEHLARGALAPGALVSAARERGPMGALRLFTPDVIDQIALVATPDGLGDALASYAATGIDELAVALFAAPDEQPALVRALGAARPAKGGSR
jgi:alkanesulfonate monooxygenase SsuD/methylene tetrahydromethanopterin reductase-like flavin-dependent oxidoreductase (luciferase family)